MSNVDKSKDEKLDVLTAVWLKIPFLWDVNAVPTGK